MTDSTTPASESEGTQAPESEFGIEEPAATTASPRWKAVGLIVGIVGLVAATVFAGFTLFGGDGKKEAAQDFLEALELEDLLGIGEMLLPGERAFYFEPMLDVIEEAERLGISAGVDLAGVQGVDLEFDDLVLEVEELADDLAWVAIHGSFTLTIDSEDLPLGSLLERYLPADWADEIPADGETTELGDGFGLAIVAHDGDWYVSLAHTIGEAARRDAGLEFPEAPALAEPTGAATPEEAMEQMLLAVADADIRGLFDVLDPDETEALRRYSALFIDDWDDGVAEFRRGLSEAGVTYSVDVIAGSERREDATVAWIASVPQFSVEIDTPDLGGEMRVSLDGDCLRILLPETLLETLQTMAPEEDIDPADFDGTECIEMSSLDETLAGGEEAAIDDEVLFGMPVIGPLYERWSTSFENMAEAEASAVQFHMTEHDGRWFVSPFRTVHRWTLAGTRTLDEELLTDLGDEIQDAVENPDAFEQEMLAYIEGFLPTLGMPLYGPEVLGPFADMPLIFMVWGEDVVYVVGEIGARFGDEVVLEVLPSQDLHAIFVDQYGPDSTGALTPEEFPFGVRTVALDIDTLVEIFNWPQILDIIPAETPEFSSVSILGAFVGLEADAVNAVIDEEFEAVTGYTAFYEGSVSSFTEQIQIRVEAGNPPDIALYPTSWGISEMAASGDAIALEDLGFTLEELERTFGAYLVSLGEYNGKHYAIPTSVNSKSLVWYNKPVFEAEGYDIPATWDDWIGLMDQMVADGYETPLCIGTGSLAATGWVATDWMEDIMLRTAGPEVYDQWVSHEIPFDDPVVLRAADLFDDMWGYSPGGAAVIPDIDFRDAPDPMVADPPGCLLHRQASFIVSFFPEGTVVGEDVDLFVFPDIDPGVDVAVIGAEFGVVFSDRPEVRAFIESFISEGVQCSIGGREGVQRISPNLDTTGACYSDPIVSRVADSILAALDAGGARLDGSDLMPSAVGTGTFWTGMNEWMRGKGIEEVFAEIEASWP